MDGFWLLALLELGFAAVASAGFYLLSRKGWITKKMGMGKAEARWMASGLAVMCLLLIWTSHWGERLTVHTLFPPRLFMAAWTYGGWIWFRTRQAQKVFPRRRSQPEVGPHEPMPTLRVGVALVG